MPKGCWLPVLREEILILFGRALDNFGKCVHFTTLAKQKYAFIDLISVQIKCYSKSIYKLVRITVGCYGTGYKRSFLFILDTNSPQSATFSFFVLYQLPVWFQLL